MKKCSLIGKIGFTVAMATLGAHSQPTYPGCENLVASQFKVTEIFNKTGSPAAATTDPNISEPVQMDLHGIYNGAVLSHVDIYFVERLGKVKHYDGLTQKVTPIGDIPVWGRFDNGLMGIALSPDFNTTRLVYFWYSPRIGNATLNRRLRLSRIKLKTDKTLDMASEQILIDIQASKTDEWHSGGPMQFDAHGDLWITIGNNSRDLNANDNINQGPVFTHYSKTDSSASAEWGPSNTASMRGGIIRIHPDTSAKGYSIPADNFGEYWAKQFESQGKTDLAAEYRNPQKVLPEVYVKGTRSNFSITVHPTKPWVAWGEVNFAGTNDELNIIDRPAFMGFPYFHGNNARIFGQQEILGYVQDSLSPRNTSPLNTGVMTLPPAKAALKTNLVNVVMGGPFYFFDPSLVSSTKFPPHFHNTWLTSSFNGGLWLHELDTLAMGIKQTHNLIPGIFTAVRLRNYVQSKYGPEGSLYILNYSGNQYGAPINPGIMRVEYSGSCIPVSLKPSIPPNDQNKAPQSAEGISFASGRFIITSPGYHRFEITTLSGQTIYSRDGRDGETYALTALRREMLLPEGTFIVRIRHARGPYARIVSML